MTDQTASQYRSAVGCLFALMAGVFPRLALFILWVASTPLAAE